MPWDAWSLSIHEATDIVVEARRTAIRQGASPAEADDVAQQTFERLCRNQETLQKLQSRSYRIYRAYIRRTAESVLISMIRTNARRSERERRYVSDVALSNSGDNNYDRIETQDQIDSLLWRLPQKQADVARLWLIDDMAPGAIARHLNLPLSSTYRILKSAQRRMADHIQQDRQWRGEQLERPPMRIGQW